jgi:hypothetical protein
MQQWHDARETENVEAPATPRFMPHYGKQKKEENLRMTVRS